MKRNSIGGILLVVALLFLAMSMTFTVFAQEDTSTTETEIEIVPDEGGEATPEPTEPPSDWKPGSDSGVNNPFMDLTDPQSTNPNVVKPTPPPTPPPPPPTNDSNSGTSEQPEEVDETETTAEATPVAPVVVPTPTTSKVKASETFVYTGVLWNGSYHVGIFLAGDKTFIAKPGSVLEGGYTVMYIDDKEVIVVKEGNKETIPIQEVD